MNATLPEGAKHYLRTRDDYLKTLDILIKEDELTTLQICEKSQMELRTAVMPILAKLNTKWNMVIRTKHNAGKSTRYTTWRVNHEMVNGVKQMLKECGYDAE